MTTRSGVEEFGAGISWGPEGVFERLSGPDVIAIEGDMFPSERRDVGEKLIGNNFAARMLS